MHVFRVFLFLLAGAGCLPLAGPAQTSNAAIDVQHYEFALRLNDADNMIEGKAEVTIQFVQESPSFHLDLTKKNGTGRGMLVQAVTETGRDLRFVQEDQALVIYPAAGDPARTGSVHTYAITYKGIPADGLIIANNKYGHRGFFGDNWPDRAHNWLPCVDHPSDKATVDFIVTAPDHYDVVANGAKQEETALPDHYKLTHWKESAPLSPKVMVIGVTGFAIDHPGDALGIPVYNYVYPEDREIGFRSYAFALQILPFYINKIGPYPFEKCGNVQSKTRFGGLENASAIFYFENSVSSPGVESLMAHEIAHQWFGDAATETEWQYLWLSEGFATYMTHCYLENKYGPDTLKQGMQQDRAKLIAFEKKRLTPVVDTTIKGDYMQLLNPNSYEKGGWALHMLRRLIGDELFWKGISTYYSTYRNRNASTADFEKVMEDISGRDLHIFFREWLYTAGHPHIAAGWKYNADKKEVSIEFRQTGNHLFTFPLEYTFDGTLHRVEIGERDTTVILPSPKKPLGLTLDPDVNLLASFEVTGM